MMKARYERTTRMKTVSTRPTVLLSSKLGETATGVSLRNSYQRSSTTLVRCKKKKKTIYTLK